MPVGYSCVVNDSILMWFADRTQQILAVEAFAAIAAPWIRPDLFRDQDVMQDLAALSREQGAASKCKEQKEGAEGKGGGRNQKEGAEALPTLLTSMP